MSIVERARQLRSKLENMAMDLSDSDALDYSEFYPFWKAGSHYVAGEHCSRCRYEDKLYKCIQEHDAQAGWTPALATSLWAEVLPGQDGTEIGLWEQPGANNGYAYGDKVIHNGHIWQSNYDPEGILGGNVWEPGVYGWDDLGPVE